jgi:hypothetical protein
MIWLFKHTQKCFVEQGCRLQGVAGTLSSEIFRGEAAKLFICRRRQFTSIRPTACLRVAGGSYSQFDIHGLAYHMPERM